MAALPLRTPTGERDRRGDTWKAGWSSLRAARWRNGAEVASAVNDAAGETDAAREERGAAQFLRGSRQHRGRMRHCGREREFEEVIPQICNIINCIPSRITEMQAREI